MNPVKQITKEDLHLVKASVNEEQNKYRHEQTKVFQNLIMKLDNNIDNVKKELSDYKTSNALTKQNMTNLQRDLSEIKSYQRENFEKIEKMLMSYETKFAPKTDVDLLKKIIFGFISTVLLVVLGALLKGVIL